MSIERVFMIYVFLPFLSGQSVVAQSKAENLIPLPDDLVAMGWNR